MAYIICIPNLKRRALFNLPFVAAVHIQPFTNVKGVVNLSKSTSIWCGKYEKKRKNEHKILVYANKLSLILSRSFALQKLQKYWQLFHRNSACISCLIFFDKYSVIKSAYLMVQLQ